jgi:hypothetical protein
MMSGQEFQEHLTVLGLSQAEAAQLLGVSTRTVTRWCSHPEEVSGPAEAALRAWRRLESLRLVWRPDSVAIVEDDAEQIAAHRREAINLADVLSRVEARGGPQQRWSVSLADSRASLGRIHVGFYKLRNGGFSLGAYSRRDGTPPDVRRDWPLIEDAIFCISQEFQQQGRRVEALMAVATAVRTHAHIFGTRGPNRPTPSEQADRQRAIEVGADKIEGLAIRTAEGEPSTYRDFGRILDELSGLGYCPPPGALVSAVARSYVESPSRVRILLVRSGKHDSPITQTIESDEFRVNQLIAGHRLKYLGTRLPVINETSRLSSYTGPDRVVLEVPAGGGVVGTQDAGLYLVLDLEPASVNAVQ